MNNCTARNRVLSWRFCRGRVRVGEDNREGSFSVGVVEVYFDFWVEKVELRKELNKPELTMELELYYKAC